MMIVSTFTISIVLIWNFKLPDKSEASILAKAMLSLMESKSDFANF